MATPLPSFFHLINHFMYTSQTEALYPFFLSCLRTQAAQPQRSLLDMIEIKLRADLALASTGRRYWVALKDLENPQRRFDLLGQPTDELLHEQLPARVFDWVQLQLLALPASTDLELLMEPAIGWRARAHAFTPEEGLPGQLVPEVSKQEASISLGRLAAAADFAPLLRGLRAYQIKRRKRARKLLAQCKAYHAQQLASASMMAVGTAVASVSTVAEAPAPTSAYRRADARGAVGVLLGYGAAAVKRAAHSVGVAMGFSGGEELAA